jgi:glycosyltransferase involved in cell wall biosynthesis
LLPPQDITGLADAIAALIDDPELRKQYATTGRELCTPLFEHKQCTRQIRDVYEEILSSS